MLRNSLNVIDFGEYAPVSRRCTEGGVCLQSFGQTEIQCTWPAVAVTWAPIRHSTFVNAPLAPRDARTVGLAPRDCRPRPCASSPAGVEVRGLASRTHLPEILRHTVMTICLKPNSLAFQQTSYLAFKPLFEDVVHSSPCDLECTIPGGQCL
jgi:hypothetical protein